MQYKYSQSENKSLGTLVVAALSDTPPIHYANTPFTAMEKLALSMPF